MLDTLLGFFFGEKKRDIRINNARIGASMSDFKKQYGKQLQERIAGMKNGYCLAKDYKSKPAHRYWGGSYILKCRNRK